MGSKVGRYSSKWRTPELLEIFKEIAEEEDMEPEHVEELFYMQWDNIRLTHKEQEWPQISIPGFGFLKPNPKRMRKRISELEGWLHKRAKNRDRYDADASSEKETRSRVENLKKALERVEWEEEFNRKKNKGAYHDSWEFGKNEEE